MGFSVGVAVGAATGFDVGFDDGTLSSMASIDVVGSVVGTEAFALVSLYCFFLHPRLQQ